MAICAFLGLGVMGFPMAGHLVKNGHDVRVWNRTQSKSDLWVKSNDGTNCPSIEEAVTGADFVILCVGNDADVISVATQAVPSMRMGAVLIDHTTASAECAKQCYETVHTRSIGFIDAPISGGEAGAVAGALTIMCGGDMDVFETAHPIMKAYGKAIKLMGPCGSGQLTKMVNQICIAGTLQGLAEGIHFAQKVGLDVSEVVEAIGKGAAQSWQMDNRALTMDKDEYDFGFAVDWMRKDLGIALRAAAAVGADLTLTKQVDGYYEEVQMMGGNRWDTSSLLKRLT